ncbi:hypothetical protein D0Z07_2813 [Hyphodiscus hymeniophilus]|uniref:Uncharacterized protein n=1 Tax=Hyphodiscus hymeniophilus TaxID=353542 RepID=A0A9P7AZ08_9HELO|nr:hypothetical protein D0Z07_2813 [Hyphodiscus hymeniophilus]
MLGGTVAALGIWSFWTFIWFSNGRNPTWHWIMVNDHIKVIVSASAEALNRVVGFMLGVECSMVLALALERSEVLFPSLVSASIGRSGTGPGKSFGMVKRIARKKWPYKGWDFRLPFVVILLCLIEIMTLGTHTVLFSDIRLGQISSHHNSTDVNFGFKYYNETISSLGGQADVLTSSDSGWVLKPPSYPVFAEYTESPFVQHGVSDTGVTLRAFLPYADSVARQSIHSYTGPTTVLDTRVTCQLPSFDNITIQVQSAGLIVAGYVKATTFTPRLGNSTWLPAHGVNNGWIRNGAAPFVCIAPLVNSSTYGVPDQWRASICQLANSGRNADGISGGLVSEFRDYATWLANVPNYNDASNFGTAYIILNISSGASAEWQEVVPSGDSRPMSLSQPLQVNEWAQFSLPPDLSFSASLCYSAFDTADISVVVTSRDTRNRTEPQPRFNFGTQRYTFGDVRNQYGQARDHDDDISSLEARGIFQLVNQSWIAGPGVQPPIYSYIRQYANLAGPYFSDGNTPYYSAFMLSTDSQGADYNATDYYAEFPILSGLQSVNPDAMHYWLFQDILAHGGSIAFAVQSLLTTLTSMVYYDQMALFDNRAAVMKSVFIESNLPRAIWGWLSVTIVFFLHIFLAWMILFWFLASTEYTMLGQKWQTVSQVSTVETKDLIAMAAQMSDDELKVKMGKVEQQEYDWV